MARSSRPVHPPADTPPGAVKRQLEEVLGVQKDLSKSIAEVFGALFRTVMDPKPPVV